MNGEEKTKRQQGHERGRGQTLLANVGRTLSHLWVSGNIPHMIYILCWRSNEIQPVFNTHYASTIHKQYTRVDLLRQPYADVICLQHT